MADQKAKLVSITLEQPIERGDTKIETLQLRKPASGELRGLSIAEISTLQTDAMIALLPRITIPPLTEAEVEGMDASDLFQCSVEVADFLVPARFKTGTATLAR